MSDEETTGDDRSEKERKPSRWRIRIAWGLGVVALVYLAVASFMFWNASTCISTYVDQSTWARLWAGLTCMTANEMGDMLAGMFAPLAFLGLIIAILLQGQDLELQRKDMARTRGVMDEQRKEAAASAKALRAQANAARRTAVFMGEQAQTLKEERMMAELAEAREAIRSAILARESTFNYRAESGWERFDARSILEFVLNRAGTVSEYNSHPFATWERKDALAFRKNLLRIAGLTKELEATIVISPSSSAIHNAVSIVDAGHSFDPTKLQSKHR